MDMTGLTFITSSSSTPGAHSCAIFNRCAGTSWLCATGSTWPAARKLQTFRLLLFASWALRGCTANLHSSAKRFLHDYENYTPYGTCPVWRKHGTLLNEVYFSADSVIPRPRLCVTRLPERYTPPRSDVLLQDNLPDASLDELQQAKECQRCWNFTHERERWSMYVEKLPGLLGNITLGPKGEIRTVLEIGCGTGGFLVAMSEKRVNGICLAYENLPFVQTASARGVIAAHMSTERALPFTSHSFDLLHAHWVMAYLGTTPENLSRVLLEWDRVVRPGGFVVQRGFWHGSLTRADNTTQSAWDHVKRVSEFLSWRVLEWNKGSAVLDFIVQKPLQRETRVFGSDADQSY